MKCDDLLSRIIHGSPYHERDWIIVHGTILEPTSYKGKKLEFFFFLDHTLSKAERESSDRYRDEPPSDVGRVEQRKDGLHITLNIPEDSLPILLQLLLAGKVKFITFGADKFRYKQASVYNYRFCETLDEDE